MALVKHQLSLLQTGPSILRLIGRILPVLMSVMLWVVPASVKAWIEPPSTCTVSGTIYDSDGITGLSDVSVTFSGGYNSTITTGLDGTYTVTVDYGIELTVTPSKPGYTFSPENAYWAYIETDPTQDFTGTIYTYTVSGTITDGVSGLEGVTVTFDYDGFLTTTTNGTGYYSMSGVPYGTFMDITPSLDGYTFSPTSLTLFNINEDHPNQDFTGTINTYTLSGTITESGSGLENVTVTFDYNGSWVTTDGSGYYSKPGVPYNTSTDIMPSLDGYTFSPTSLILSNINEDHPNQDFTATHDVPLPVQMTNLSASANKAGGVVVSWRTASEVDCAGFHVWRGETENGEYQKITTVLIPGQGNSSIAHVYSFTDRHVQTGNVYWYQIEEIDSDGRGKFFGPIRVEGLSPIPARFGLSQNYPNPFNPTTTIEYQLPENAHVSVRICDLSGKEVAVLVDENKEAGHYSIHWDGKNSRGNPVSSGIYLFQIQVDGFNAVRKLSLLR